MKTTVNIRDDIFRKAKARAALAGKSLGRFLEESLEQVLSEEEPDTRSWRDWAVDLPTLSPAAVKALDEIQEDSDFRRIDPEMWT